MGMAVGGTDEYNSEINVTPMVDVMLVLLIIFMIVTPLLQDGVNVNIPKDTLAPEEDKNITSDTSVVVSITKDGNFYLGTNKTPFPLDSLGTTIESEMEGKTGKDRIVYVRSDIDAPYEKVVQAIDVIRRQDVDKVGLVADKRKEQ